MQQQKVSLTYFQDAHAHIWSMCLYQAHYYTNNNFK